MSWRVVACLAGCMLPGGEGLATSGVGIASVSQSGGQPCFAVPSSTHTRSSPLRLLALSVTQGERRDWRELPDELWGFTVDAPGVIVDASGGGCIRYGDLPASATARGAAQPLQPARIYRVEMTARPQTGGSATSGYQAQFCLKPAGGDAPTVRTVPWDEAARRWRHEVCTAP